MYTFNPAYGTLILCPFPPSESFEPTQKECDGVLSEAIEPLLNNTAPVPLAFAQIMVDALLLHNFDDKSDATTVMAFSPPFPDVPKTDGDSRPFALSVALALQSSFLQSMREKT